MLNLWVVNLRSPEYSKCDVFSLFEERDCTGKCDRTFSYSRFLSIYLSIDSLCFQIISVYLDIDYLDIQRYLCFYETMSTFLSISLFLDEE